MTDCFDSLVHAVMRRAHDRTPSLLTWLRKGAGSVLELCSRESGEGVSDQAAAPRRCLTHDLKVRARELFFA